MFECIVCGMYITQYLEGIKNLSIYFLDTLLANFTKILTKYPKFTLTHFLTIMTVNHDYL